MTRYNFAPNRKYAGRLTSIHQRPIENDPTLGLHLLRLEFDIYWQLQLERPTLRSDGEIACRDLIIGPLISPAKDTGQHVYATALQIQGDLTVPGSWLRAVDRGAWVEIVFGPPEKVGSRNPFQSIDRFNPTGWGVEPYRFDRSQEWVSVTIAADAARVSESTVRRRVDELESDFGARLVRRTSGRQRRIHLPLFMHLLTESE